jgi:anaerobic selenocysteine-containing dehydrogenase
VFLLWGRICHHVEREASRFHPIYALVVTDAVRPGVVCSLKGAWFRTSDNGQTVSALAPTHHADIAGGACYNDTRVEVAAYTALA